jgi:hypothetical protein
MTLRPNQLFVYEGFGIVSITYLNRFFVIYVRARSCGLGSYFNPIGTPSPTNTIPMPITTSVMSAMGNIDSTYG